MKPPFSPPADLGKHKSASDSFGTFLTLMRTLEIVIMNRADFCKRQMENLEGKLSRYRSEAFKLSSQFSLFLALTAQKSDLASAEIKQLLSKANTDLACEKVLKAELMKMSKEMVDDVINHVYTTPLIARSSHPSRDLCDDFFERFQLLEHGVDCLAKFDHQVDLGLRGISALMPNLMIASLMASSLINSQSTDHNNETHAS